MLYALQLLSRRLRQIAQASRVYYYLDVKSIRSGLGVALEPINRKWAQKKNQRRRTEKTTFQNSGQEDQDLQFLPQTLLFLCPWGFRCEKHHFQIHVFAIKTNCFPLASQGKQSLINLPKK
jgi:hypothetical protein